MNELIMISVAHDICLLYLPTALSLDSKKKPAEISCLQKDDSLMLANTEFEEMEKVKSKKFESKPTEVAGECIT